MRALKYLVLIVALLGFNRVLAQTYTVTSTADSGPGTLRQGLLNAATIGRTSLFTINFQLPGNPADNINRTIRLRSALPTVTSNVVIDGSSQTSWPALGVSGAKVIIEPEFPNTTFSGLTIGQYSTTGLQTTGVEIYGLYLRNFATITNLQTVDPNQGSGIVVDYRSNNITIGAPGKGNVIGNNINGILIQNSFTYTTVNPIKIKIQSNIIGLLYDGITANTNVIGISASLYDCALDVGGDNTNEGNTVAANRINIDINRFYYATNTRFDINVINNKIGVDITGKKDFHELPLFLSSSSLDIVGLKVDAVNTALYVRNNIVGGNRTVGVSLAKADFILTGNAIGSDATGTVSMGNGIGISVKDNATGTIGGDDEAEKNLIGNNDYGIETTSDRPVKITKNSMFCNLFFGIGETLTNLQPYIQILKQRTNYVAGRATPNSAVELFYTANCRGICEGKTYIETVRAGSDGRWEYSGTLSGKVVATASLLNATTSPFSTAELLPDEAIVEPVTCNAKGSITIPEPREGFTFSWVKIEIDGSRVPRGNTQSITDLEVGVYEVTIDDGCKAFTIVPSFIIKDQTLTKPTINPVTPTCGQTIFQLTANVFFGKGTIRYEWFSAANPTVKLPVEGSTVNLPEGEYFVQVTDEAGCSLKSVNIIIKRKPQPKIKSVDQPVPAACGKNNGAIKGFALEDITGTATFEWFKHDPITGIMGTIPVSTSSVSPDLENVEGGDYTLKITDQGQCSPVFSPRYHIPIYNTIAVIGGSVTNTKCGLANGSITSPTLTDADTYQWIGPDNMPINVKTPYSAGMQIGLTGLMPGTYTLIASNSLTGCDPVSRPFTINAITPQDFTYTADPQNTTCGLTNGSITLHYTSVAKPTRFEWRDASGTIIPGTMEGIKDLPAGSYTLYTWDLNDCQKRHDPSFIIDITPKLVIVPDSGTPNNDGCGLKRGSITGIQVIGGVPDYDYIWINEAGETVGVEKNLEGVGAGIYRLKVTDKTACSTDNGGIISQPYTIDDVPFEIETPTVSDIRVCYVSDITLPIIGPQEGIYQLFTNINAQPILETNNGVFNFKVSKTADYYIRRKLGSCLSDFTKMHIEVTHDNLEIGNVITPNGDGLNDVWMLRGLPDYVGNNIKIYTRGGQLVYESIGNYTKPFDGRFRGKELPAGVYFYVIDLRAECKPIGGSVTLLR